MTEYYNETARNYNELHGEEQIRKAKIIKREILKKKTKGLLLDIGGGTGIATEIFLDKFDCVIIDPSENLIEQGSSKIEKILASAEELPFADKKFDVIISLTALHHANLKKALKEIKRVSKDDTIVAVSFLKKSKTLEKFRKLFRESYSSAREIDDPNDIIFLNF